MRELLETRERALDAREKFLSQQYADFVATFSAQQDRAFRALVDAIKAAGNAFDRLQLVLENQENNRGEDDGASSGIFTRFGGWVSNQVGRINLDTAINRCQTAVAAVQDALVRFIDAFKDAASVARDYLSLFVGRRSRRWDGYSSSSLSQTAKRTDVSSFIGQKLDEAARVAVGEGQGPEIVFGPPEGVSAGSIVLNFMKPRWGVIQGLNGAAIGQLPKVFEEVGSFQKKLKSGILESSLEENRHKQARAIESHFVMARDDRGFVNVADELLRFKNSLQKEGRQIENYLSSQSVADIIRAGEKARQNLANEARADSFYVGS
ncbi:hypothetical protein ACLBWS_17955 [Brucellaceae bacterium D45D]